MTNLASKHEIGRPKVCSTCNCNFSTKRAIKQHIRGQYKGDFKYKCDIEGCKFKGTDSKDAYNVHKVNAHKRKAKKTFTCTKCQKVFPGKGDLQKHTKRGLCQIPKNFECDICHRSCKTKAYLTNHVRCHAEGVEKLPFSKCNRIMSSKSSMINHQNWHKGIEILRAAKKVGGTESIS